MRRSLLLPCLALTLAGPLSAQVPQHKLPRPGELVDTAAFAAFARARAGEARGDAALSLVFDSAGRLESARAVEGSLPPEVKAALADSVVAYLKPQAPWPGGTWWTRLAVRVGPELALHTQPCHVEGPAQTSTGDLMVLLPAGGNPPTGRTEYRFLVSETGRVLRVEAGPGTRPLSPIDAARLAERLRYTPGTVDGRPVPMWTAIRIQRAGVRTR